LLGLYPELGEGLGEMEQSAPGGAAGGPGFPGL